MRLHSTILLSLSTTILVSNLCSSNSTLIDIPIYKKRLYQEPNIADCKIPLFSYLNFWIVDGNDISLEANRSHSECKFAMFL